MLGRQINPPPIPLTKIQWINYPINTVGSIPPNFTATSSHIICPIVILIDL